MTWSINTPRRLRFLVNSTGDPASLSYQLEHRINGGAWLATGTSSAAAVYIYPSANISASAADTTTSQLTGGSGSFTAGRISDDTAALPGVDIGSGGNTELEWCIYANATYLPGGNTTVDFRVTKGGIALDTYTQTPSVTLTVAATLAWFRA